jgi:chemotaxis protein CheC
MNSAHNILTPVQQDALKEIFNIGSGNAATTLSEAIHQPVLVSVPQIKVSTVEEALSSLVKPDLPVVCLVNIFVGDLSGCTLWLMPGDSALAFAQECWHKMPRAKNEAEFHFGHIHLEISSVLTESYLSALSDMLELTSIPSPPLMLSGPMQKVMGRILGEYARFGEILAYVQNRFRFPGEAGTASGYFMMLPDAASLKRIMTAMKLEGS